MPKKREAIITGKLPSGGGGGGEGKTYTGLPTATAETIVDNNANTILEGRKNSTRTKFKKKNHIRCKNNNAAQIIFSHYKQKK